MTIPSVPFALRFASRPPNPPPPLPVAWNPALKGYTPAAGNSARSALSGPTYGGTSTQFGPVQDEPMGDPSTYETYA